MAQPPTPQKLVFWSLTRPSLVWNRSRNRRFLEMKTGLLKYLSYWAYCRSSSKMLLLIPLIFWHSFNFDCKASMSLSGLIANGNLKKFPSIFFFLQHCKKISWIWPIWNFVCHSCLFSPVLWIRIRMDPQLLPGSGSGIIVQDPDPAKYERADK